MRSVIRLVSTVVFPLPAAALTAIDRLLASMAFLCAVVHLISPIDFPPLRIYIQNNYIIFRRLCQQKMKSGEVLRLKKTAEEKILCRN